MQREPPGTSGAGSEADLEFPHANIDAVQRIGALLASSFGPTPRDKLIVTSLATRSESDSRVQPPVDEYVVTSDGATILEELEFEHPVAPLVRRVAGPERPGETDVEGADITDGVKTSVLLLANLLVEGRTLVDRGVHPTTVRKGYAAALDVARETIATSQLEPTAPRILAVARTAMTGNDVGGRRDRWARMAVRAVSQVGVPDERTFAVRHASGESIDDSRYVHGAVLDRNNRASEEMPRRLEDADVLVLGGEKTGGLKRRRTTKELTIQPSDPGYASDFRELRDRHRQDTFEALVETGADVVVARTGIDRDYQSLLAEHGIVGVRRVNSLKLRQVALATGATIVTDPTNLSPDVLGTAGVVEEIELPEYWTERGDRRMMVFDECPDPGSVSVLLTGVWRQVADQLTRELRKAALAASMARGDGEFSPGCLPGGGATDVRIVQEVRRRATTYGSKEQLAVTAFADAVEGLVGTLAYNAGYDPIDARSELHRRHAAGDDRTGIVCPEPRLTDVVDAGVLDPVESKRRAYETATEVAGIVLNIDDAIDATFTDEPITPDEAIDDDAAERHVDWLEDRDKPTRWDS